LILNSKFPLFLRVCENSIIKQLKKSVEFKGTIHFMKYTVLLVGLVIFLNACENNNPETAANTPRFVLECDLTQTYTPATSPIVSPSTNGISSQTVLAIHGKNGSPLRDHMTTLKTRLNAEGYNVIMPYMPWSDLSWSGSLCDSMAYINEIITAERTNESSKDNYIILLGHSLAGPVSLAYSALENTNKADAVNVVAPGHFIHQSSVLADAHGASIEAANTMAANGMGNDIATFQTYNNGSSVDIATTANIYLSMHDTAQFPNILSTIPENKTSTLWLAGLTDSLTGVAKNLGIIDSIPNDNDFYTYKEVSGDHFSVLETVPNELQEFF